jgi:hypothetical protein
MNIIKTLFFIGLGALLISSCKEVGTVVDLGKNKPLGLLLDTAYTEAVQSPDVKNVLIEEFTGVRCLNCPQGHAELRSLKLAYPGRVIGLSLHSFIQDEVYPYSKVDLKSVIAQRIEQYLLYPGFKPNGAIDRVNFSGGQTVCNDYLDWATLLPQRMSVATPVNLLVTPTFNATSGELLIDVKAHYTQDQTEPNKLSLFLVEDSIVTAQLQPNNTVDTNYIHNEIVREVYSDTLGDKLEHDLKRGTTVQRVYKVNVSGKNYEYKHLKVLAFIHRYATTKEILQAKEIEIGN